MSMPKYYVTTPIYYVNDKPHIGHAYTTVVADALARFHRLQGDKVFFVTGTDENSQKNVQAMEKAGEKDLQAYLDRMAGVWKETWKDLDISLTDFIRTTDERHVAGVNRFWDAVMQSGDLEKRSYEGLYCVGCEGFKTEAEIVDGRCTLHPNKELERLQEENWFFKLSNYREALLVHLEKNPDFVQPESRRHEIHNYIQDFMTDVSVSREVKKVSVGIPVPGDDSQRIYVWFDALINYLTAAGYGTDEKLFKKMWPVDLQLVGKDIIKFHCALWPAMMMSAAKNDALLRDKKDQPLLPKRVHAHGFFTINGQKISKSLGNAIDPRELIPKFGFDAVRYYLLREIPFGEDGDFSVERLKERYGTDLGNTFGNLVNRAVAMSRKYFEGKVPELSATRSTLGGWHAEEALPVLAASVASEYAGVRCDLALESIWTSLFQANKYVEDTQPFKLVKTDPGTVGDILYQLLEACRWYAWLVYPVMPEISRKIFEQLGLDADKELKKGWEDGLKWGGLKPGTALPEPKILFPRLGVVPPHQL